MEGRHISSGRCGWKPEFLGSEGPSVQVGVCLDLFILYIGVDKSPRGSVSSTVCNSPTVFLNLPINKLVKSAVLGQKNHQCVLNTGPPGLNSDVPVIFMTSLTFFCKWKKKLP